MSIVETSFPAAAEQEQIDDPMTVIAPEVVAVNGTAQYMGHTHVERDRNDPLGYYGGLLDDAQGDVITASRAIMDSFARRSY